MAHLHGDDDSPLAPEFEAAASYLGSLATSGANSIPESALLQFYGLYKQATLGDCSSDKPSILQPGARAKWAAWKELEGIGRARAQSEYVALLQRLQPQWSPEGATGGSSTQAGGPVFSSLAGQVGADEDQQLDVAALPLHAAASSGDIQAVQRLLSDRAEVDGRDGEGCSALHWAADKGHVQVLRLLLRHGADINAQDNDGLTPLHYAALAEEREAAEVLLQSGADGTIENAEGEAAKDIAPPSWKFLS